MGFAWAGLLVMLELPAIPARPIAPAQWARPGDYPGAARRYNLEGQVGYRLQVDSGGTPVGCEIIAPSGVESLDQITCPLLLARARFEPARDSQGGATSGQFEGTISWAIPPERQPIYPFSNASFSMVRDIRSGTFENCSVSYEGAIFEDRAAVCDGARNSAAEAGLPANGRVRLDVQFITDAAPPSHLPEGERVTQVIAEIEINPRGRVWRCNESLLTSASPSGNENACARWQGLRFIPIQTRNIRRAHIIETITHSPL